MTEDAPIVQRAIDALNAVLNVHENHLYPEDERLIRMAKTRLIGLKIDGYK